MPKQSIVRIESVVRSSPGVTGIVEILLETRQPTRLSPNKGASSIRQPNGRQRRSLSLSDLLKGSFFILERD